MADETVRTPNMFSKFIQLTSHNNVLYALDDNGVVWWKDKNNGGIWRTAINERSE